MHTPTHLLTAVCIHVIRNISHSINIEIDIVIITHNYPVSFSAPTHKNCICVGVLLVIAQVLL